MGLEPRIQHMSKGHPGHPRLTRNIRLGPGLSLNEVPGPIIKGWGEVSGEAGEGHYGLFMLSGHYQ